ncbi:MULTISPECIES: hypothetical protein [unclassified Streptomyces]|uniref:hypothetical protein n=1 Tax=unclassified Streptomyces TaxID=2593676 RepID=UPI003D7263FE
MSESERVPLGEVLPGMGAHPLPEDWEAVSAFILIKCKDEDGDFTWSFRTTEPIDPYELLGALTVQVDLIRKRMLSGWDVDDDEASDELSDE